MEKEKEIKRLVRILDQIAFNKRFSVVKRKKEELAEFNAQQYNRILARLKEIEPAIENLFVELKPDTNMRIICVSARELAEFFDEYFEPKERKSSFTRGFVFDFSSIFGERCR